MNNTVDTAGTIEDKLHQLHFDLREKMPEIHRFAIALYDAGTDNLKTFTHSTLESGSIEHYAAKLNDVPSLKELAQNKSDRVVPDMSIFANTGTKHSQQLLAQGFRSSYTKPFYNNGSLCGFLFFDAVEKGFFSQSVVRHLSVYVNLAALMVVNAMAPVEVLRSAVNLVRDFSHYRDENTGSHIDRMSRYSHLLAMSLAEKFDLADEFVEFIYLFAPLHDIGKITIPDSVLLKKGKLTPDEMEIMRGHVDQGGEMVMRMSKTFKVEDMGIAKILFNIVTSHHEAIDGSGYPKGLAGKDIPIEARIITVADVFDALTSSRPYKAAWSNEEALTFLRQHAGTKFDIDCVEVLHEKLDHIEEIQRTFSETSDNVFREGYTEDL